MRLPCRLVADYLFAAVFYEDVNRARESGELVRWVGERLPQKDALRAGPPLSNRCRRLEDGRCIGEEAAVPEVAAAAFEDVEVAALEIEAQRAASLIFAVEDEEVF